MTIVGVVTGDVALAGKALVALATAGRLPAKEALEGLGEPAFAVHLC